MCVCMYTHTLNVYINVHIVYMYIVNKILTVVSIRQ